MKPQKLMITGASGLLGSRVADLAMRQGYTVYSCFKEHESLFGNRVRLDITSKGMVDKVFENLKPDIVVHAAALTSVEECEANKELALKVNYEGTFNITMAASKVDAFLVYCSTDYVFDGEKGLYREEDEPNPINYYGYTKLRGEEVVKEYEREWMIARTSVIYGNRPATGRVNFALWIIEKLSKGEEIKVLTDQWVSPTLSTSLGEMILEATQRKLSGVYHLAGASRISRFEFAQTLASIFALNKELIKPTTLIEMNWLARRPRDSSLNVSKSTRILANKPIEIKEALGRLKMERDEYTKGKKKVLVH